MGTHEDLSLAPQCIDAAADARLEQATQGLRLREALADDGARMPLPFTPEPIRAERREAA